MSIKNEYIAFLKTVLKDSLKETLRLVGKNTTEYTPENVWLKTLDVDFDSEKCYDINLNVELSQNPPDLDNYWKLHIYVSNPIGGFENLDMSFTYDIDGKLLKKTGSESGKLNTSALRR